MPKGKVKFVVLDRNFGFITPEDGSESVHFTLNTAPKSVRTEGAEVEYVLGPAQAGKSLHATKVESLADGVSPGPPTPSASPPGKAKKDAAATTSLKVSWKFDPPIELEETNLIRTYIGVQNVAGSPITGLRVKLFRVNDKGDKDEVMTPSKRVTTNGAGEAYFALYIPKTQKFCDLLAQQGEEHYSNYWPPKESANNTSPVIATDAVPTGSFDDMASEPEPSESPKPKEPPMVQKLSHNPEGVYTFLVQTAPNTEVTLKGISVLARKIPCGPDTPWTHGPFTSDEEGNLEIEVKVENEAARGDLIVCVGQFRAKPQYLAHLKRPTK